ncbi:MAG: hypothetical protein AAGJ73_10275 [Pseudomonadota bacterium]
MEKSVHFKVKLEDGARGPALVVDGEELPLRNNKHTAEMRTGELVRIKFSFLGVAGSLGTLTIQRDGFNSFKITDRIVDGFTDGGWTGEMVI